MYNKEKLFTAIPINIGMANAEMKTRNAVIHSLVESTEGDSAAGQWMWTWSQLINGADLRR